MTPNEQVEAWFVMYGDDVYRFLVYFTGSLDVDDLVQETFLRALRHVHKAQTATSPKSWLLTVAHNLAVDARRRKKPVTVSEEAILSIESKDLPVELRIENLERTHELMAFLQTLDHKHRTLLILRCVQELSFKQIGELLGCSEITARSRYHRARKQAELQLREKWQGGVLA